MKKHFLLPVLLLIMAAAFAQPKSKQKEKEKPPTQKELQDMMKEMQQGMNDMSPEDKKMMDSMGIKMPDVKSIQKSVAGISDAQLKKAMEDDNRIVPVKDAIRINTALATTLTESAIAAHVDKVHTTVLSKMKPGVKAEADKLLQQGHVQNSNLGKTAVFLWISGKPMHALYVAGLACKESPADADNINNYAAFLTMAGAEQSALPLLMNLNKRYPNNSSILNNICQAWFGLGDVDRANKYADSTIRICAYHPQANLTKCFIEESKGHTAEAIAAAKRSIKRSYSPEKENKLKKLGYKLKPADIDWDKPMPQDPMGLSKFTSPAYPANVEQSKPLENVWKAFKESCNDELTALNAKRAQLEVIFQQQSQARMQQVMRESQQGKMVALVPPSAAKAVIKLRPLVAEDEGNMAFVFAKDMEPLLNAYKKAGEKEEVLRTQQKAIDKKYEDQIGEGKPNPLAAICADENAIRNEFLRVNSDLETAFKQYQQAAQRKISNLLYYCQYTQWPEEFELAKVNAQIAWLRIIADQKVMFKDKSSWCPNGQSKPGKKDSLQHFDDVACKYTSTLDLGLGEITSQCSRTIVKLSLPGVDFNMKQDIETDRIISGSVMVGVSKSLGATRGPIGAEIEATAGVEVEFDNSGVTDVSAVAGLNANVAGQTVAGVEGRVSVNSGPSVSGKGLLGGR